MAIGKSNDYFIPTQASLHIAFFID
jgi:hypothetical protein